MARGIRTAAFDAVEIRAPLRAYLHRSGADCAQRDTGGCIPDARGFVDVRRGGPTGAPGLVVTVAVKIDGQIDPIAGRRDLELAIVANVLPVAAEKHLHYIAIPKLVARASAFRGQ